MPPLLFAFVRRKTDGARVEDVPPLVEDQRPDAVPALHGSNHVAVPEVAGRLMKQSSHQKLVRAVGAVLMVAALWFLYQATHKHWTSLGNWRPTSEIWLGLAVLALLYGTSQYLLAEAWHRVVALYGTEPRLRTYPSLTSM